MAVTKDYMYWRGDVPFSVAPVTEADEFLICMMGMFGVAAAIFSAKGKKNQENQ